MLACTVKFLTPAFLGDANQEGRWRTPPFKALLRQWWRVAYAQKQNFRVNVAELRSIEGKLFGNAWLMKPGKNEKKQEADFSQSLVRLRLARWDQGRLSSWSGLEANPLQHPEVHKFRIGPHLYLGYGPLKWANPNTELARRLAINSGELASLEFAYPDGDAPLIENALALMDCYATVGGRSRNGWGSFVFERRDGPAWEFGEPPLRNWLEALEWDWPHAIGRDSTGPLIWQTKESFLNWREAMRSLAIVRLGVRTQFVFPSSGPPHASPQPRHWLSYPITKHTCKLWRKNLRLPNSLRFKIRPAPDDPNRLVGVVFHMPCQPPSEFRPNGPQIQQTWEQVHELLDELTKPLPRTYPSIADENRNRALKPLLDQVSLKRIPR